MKKAAVIIIFVGLLIFAGCLAGRYSEERAIEEKIAKIEFENRQMKIKEREQKEFVELLREEDAQAEYDEDVWIAKLGERGPGSAAPEIKLAVEDIPEEERLYYYTQLAGVCKKAACCSMVDEADLDPARRLEIVFETENGALLMQLKDREDGYLRGLYEGLETDLTFDEFYNKHPVLYWENPRGEWVRFKSRSIFPSQSC